MKTFEIVFKILLISQISFAQRSKSYLSQKIVDSIETKIEKIGNEDYIQKLEISTLLKVIYKK